MSCHATDAGQGIVDEYSKLSAEFNRLYSENSLEKAYEIASKQLEFDSSDSEAFLRLALSIEGNCSKVKPYFSQYGSSVSENDMSHLAKAIIKRSCNISLDRAP